MSFSHLGLSDKVLAAVTAAGYTTPTPIQDQAIPHVLARRDVLGIAQTGTGKTAAFVLPMLTMLEQGRARARMPRTLILEPTRELAAQVEESFIKYGAKHKLNVALIIGGVSFDDQDTKLTRGVDVLIATPGRLLDHLERGRLLLTGVELLVIDEADRMLDMGFIPDIERICKLVPFTRQTLFFTATMPPEIQRITEQFLHNPVRVEVSRPASTVATTTQLLVKTGREPQRQARDAAPPDPRAPRTSRTRIIFCNRKREVALLHRSLVQARLLGGRAARRHGPVGPHRGARPVPQERGHAAGRLRRRRPRPRHSRRQPRLQFRRAASRRRLRPPHRPHRPRRTQRRRASRSSAPADQKSVAAIEKLIGQTIAVGRRSAGDRRRGRRRAIRGSVRAEASQARTGRSEHRSKRTVRTAVTSRAESRRRSRRRIRSPPRERSDAPRRASGRQRQARHEDAFDPAHLPAFLLRPVRVKA